MEKFDISKLADLENINVTFDENGKMILNFANGPTVSTTTGISSVQPTIILKDILKAAQARSYFLDVCYQTDAPVKTGIKSIEVPVATTNIQFTEFTTEASARTMTQIDNLNTVTFTYSLKKYGASISKNVVSTTVVDIIQFAREQLIYDVSRRIDEAIANALASVTSPAATLYGGDATSNGDLADGDILTTDLIAKAIKELEEEGWENEPDKPFVLFIAPPQKEALLRDSQFVNAAEYGSSDVVFNGEIKKYLGARVVCSPRVPAKGTADGWGTNGHVCMLVKAKVCAGIVWFEKPTLDAEYLKNEATTNIYLDVAYDVKVLQPKSIVLIKVSDA